MRLYLSAGLVSSALLVSAVSPWLLHPVAFGVLEDQRHTAGRLLRGSTDEKRDSEEERSMPTTTLLQVEESVTNRFKDLKLKIPTLKKSEFEKGEVTAFLSRPELRAWFYREKKAAITFAAFASFNQLESEITPKGLARMIQHELLQEDNFLWNMLSPSKRMARMLEKVQFEKWRSKMLTKAVVNEKVLGLPVGTALDPIVVRYGLHSKKYEGVKGKYLFDN
uniref:RxLR effector candidate protein n=2 Tax=Hyaloperonospora arabidopsidis (strain Emoy2) TaxID=559515 RepID=A0A090BGL6_HYAAE|nr:RxLR effector candidate protein [Hyaloperonospora arabidopsidis Emoy2]